MGATTKNHTIATRLLATRQRTKQRNTIELSPERCKTLKKRNGIATEQLNNV
jgi:hypothetical protein